MITQDPYFTLEPTVFETINFIIDFCVKNFDFKMFIYCLQNNECAFYYFALELISM